jgi:hypothetical protein
MAELSEDVGCSRDELDETVQSFGCFQPASIDRPGGTGTGATLADVLAIDDDELPASLARAQARPGRRTSLSLTDGPSWPGSPIDRFCEFALGHLRTTLDALSLGIGIELLLGGSAWASV